MVRVKLPPAYTRAVGVLPPTPPMCACSWRRRRSARYICIEHVVSGGARARSIVVSESRRVYLGPFGRRRAVKVGGSYGRARPHWSREYRARASVLKRKYPSTSRETTRCSAPSLAPPSLFRFTPLTLSLSSELRSFARLGRSDRVGCLAETAAAAAVCLRRNNDESRGRGRSSRNSNGS